jgi:hypothetical protein
VDAAAGVTTGVAGGGEAFASGVGAAIAGDGGAGWPTVALDGEVRCFFVGGLFVPCARPVEGKLKITV